MDQVASQSHDTAVLVAERVVKEVSSPEGVLTILSDISFSIAAGESVAIQGASGAGKSTLLALLAGLDIPTKGSIWLNGSRLTELDEDGRAAVRAASVGFVFQSFHLVPSLNALENVMLPLELAGTTSPRAAALEVLGKVGLEARARHYPSQLSGGEKQRVALARALTIEPRILLLDEPLAALDARARGAIREFLGHHLSRRKGAALVVSHDARDVRELGAEVHVMEDGRIVQSGRPDELAAAPATEFVAAFFDV